jgi:hypothetical protein
MGLNLVLVLTLSILAIWLLFQKLPPPPTPPPPVQTYLPQPIGTSINTAAPLMTGGLCLDNTGTGVPTLQNCNAASNTQMWYLDSTGCNGVQCVLGVSGSLTSVEGAPQNTGNTVVNLPGGSGYETGSDLITYPSGEIVNYDAFGSQALTFGNHGICLSTSNGHTNVGTVLQTSSVWDNNGDMSGCTPWTIGGNSTPNVFVPPTQSTLHRYVQPISNLMNAYDRINTNMGLGVGVQISNADGTLCLDTTINGLSMQACEVMPKCNSGQLWQYYSDASAAYQICLWHQSEGEGGREYWRDYCPDSSPAGSDGDGHPQCSTGNNTYYNAMCINNYGAQFTTVGMYRTPNWNDNNDEVFPYPVLSDSTTLMMKDSDYNTYYLTRSTSNVNATVSLVQNSGDPEDNQKWYVLDQLSQIPFALRGEGATCVE